MNDRDHISGKGQSDASAGADSSAHTVAIALRYDLDPDGVPKVVASGRGEMAESILAAAFAAGVKVRKDADLAEVLGAMDLGEDIPAEAFVAVAEVLRYVFEANGKLRILQEREGAIE